MADRPLRRLTSKPLLHAEEIDIVLDKFRSEMAGVSAQLAAATAVESSQGRVVAAPDLTARADEALREWLQDETLALVEPNGPRGIEEHELHHELLKKALAGLKRDTLLVIARDNKIVPEAKLESLIEQVAGAYDWDERRIAQLVLDYTEDPRETEGGLNTRVFILVEPADTNYFAARLDYVSDRYYRTDIAKWFVFERFRRVASTLHVWGSLQSYRARVDAIDTDRLTTKQEEAPSILEVRNGSRVALVHEAKSYSAARSMLAAFKTATRADTLGYVPNIGSDTAVTTRQLHPYTAFMLDILVNRLDSELFRQRNAILARFRLSQRNAGDEPSLKPALHAVRFDGDNLLDSATASGLMFTEGRPLVDVTVSVFATEADRSARIPIRLVIERSAILVQTGLVSGDVDLATDVHQEVVRQVEAALAQPASKSAANRVERIVRARAERLDPDADAQLMTDAAGAAQQRTTSGSDD